jgi:hypothetical protein
MSKDDRELIERLRAKRDTGRRTLGGGNVWADGRPSEMWGCEPIFDYVNPDGPAAATRLEALQAQPVGEAADILREAISLAEAMWRRAYRHKAPDWQPLDSLRGVLSQIDNMVAGLLSEHELAAQSPPAEVLSEECELCDGQGCIWNNADPTSRQFVACACISDGIDLSDAALAERLDSYAGTCTGLEPKRILKLAVKRLGHRQSAGGL